MIVITPTIQKNLVDVLLDIDRSVIRFVAIIDSEKNTLVSKTQNFKHSILSSEEELQFAFELITIKDLLQKLSNQLGNVISFNIQREEINLMFFVFDNLIISLACESYTDDIGMGIISRRVESKIKNMFITNAL